MSKLDLKRLASGGRHTVVVKLPFEDDSGKITTEEMRVVYRGVSLNDGAELQERAEAEADDRKGFVKALCGTVIELPDVEDNDQPVKPDAAFFETIDTFYLNRINAAIRADRNGPNV